MSVLPAPLTLPSASQADDDDAAGARRPEAALPLSRPTPRWPPREPSAPAPEGWWAVLPRWWRRIPVPNFATDTYRRDFISIGAAAGMAACLGAPIGGVLYVLEEMGSYWTNSLALRVLGGSVLASVTAAFIGTAVLSPDKVGEFLPQDYATFFVGRRPAVYTIGEIPAFVALGIIAGFVGGAFILVSRVIIQFRIRFVARRNLTMAVTIGVLLVWCSALFALPFATSCVPVSPDFAAAQAASLGASAGTYATVRYDCPAGQHNQLAALSMTRFDINVKRLIARGIPTSFDVWPLAVWALFIFIGCVVTCNMSFTPGVVLPFLMVGAAVGRFVGRVLYDWFGYITLVDGASQVHFDPGVYAVVGCAAFFSGATRTTLSMSIMILEITSDLNLLLPILIGAFCGHLITSAFTETFYELLIRMRKLPFLSSKPAYELSQLTAGQVMTRDPVRLGCVEPVQHILDVLESCSHNSFPVVLQTCSALHYAPSATQAQPSFLSPVDGRRSLATGSLLSGGARAHHGQGCDNTYLGMVRRSHLLALLNRRVWRPDSKPFTPDSYARVLERKPPRLAQLRARLTAEDLEAGLDLVPWVDQGAFVVSESAPGSHAFMLFRQLMLRHLPVVDVNNHVVGLITRLELLGPVIKHRFAVLAEKEKRSVERGGPDWMQDWCQRHSALEVTKEASLRRRRVGRGQGAGGGRRHR
jgi:chloride channel 7